MPGEGLLERDTELAALRAVVRAAAGRRGTLTVLEGPAGSGKTRLLAELRDEAEEAGLRVLRARGGEFELAHAHGVLRQLLERPLRDLPAAERAAVLAGPAGVAATSLGLGDAPEADPETTGDDPGFAVVHGAYWLVQGMAESAPLLVVVDDAHWADTPSLEALVYLARRVEDLPVGLVVAVRTGEPTGERAPLRALVLESAGGTLSPPPLSESAGAALLTAELGTEPDPEFARAAHGATGGNPFLLGQLAAAVRADDLAPIAAHAGRVAGLGPKGVARAMELRLAAIAPEAMAFAHALAVLGDESDPVDVARLAGVDDATVAGLIDDLARVGTLAAGIPLSFAHPIVRAAIHNAIPPGYAAELHAVAAELLADRGAPPSRLAPHLLASAPAGRADVVEQLRVSAAAATAEGAFEIAAALLRRALAEPPPAAQRCALQAELGRVAFLAGEMDVAVGALGEAVAATPDPAERAPLRVALARARGASSGPGPAVDELERAMQDAAAGGDPQAVIAVKADLTGYGVLDREAFDRVAALLDGSEPPPGDTDAERALLAGLARHAMFRGRPASEAVALARRAIPNGNDPQPWTTFPPYVAVMILFVGDEDGEAERHIARAERLLRERGSVPALASLSTVRAGLLHHRGEPEAVDAEAAATLAVLQERAALRSIAAALRCLSLVELGRYDDAERLLAELGLDGDLWDVLPNQRVLFARGGLRHAQGRHADADADLRVLEDRVAQRDGYADLSAPWRPLAVRVALALGDEERAQRLATEHRAVCDAWGTRSAVGEGLHVEALVQRDIPQLERAVEILADAPGQLFHARALCDLGVLLRVSGRREAAREPLREAADLASRLRATVLAERAREELKAAGARPRRLQFSGVDALTASERRVAELAADGLTNREIAQTLFVTPKTVENHLARVYTKLGIASRQALPDALAVA